MMFRYFILPDPNTSLYARKQFNSWNKLLECGGCKRVVFGENLSIRVVNDAEECQPQREGELSMSIATQLKRQQDGSYAVSVYDAAMAIIDMARHDRFELLSFNNHERIVTVRNSLST